MTPEKLDVAAAPLSSSEADYGGNDTKTNENDPRNNKRPRAWQENREQCRADERNGRRHEGFISGMFSDERGVRLGERAGMSLDERRRPMICASLLGL